MRNRGPMHAGRDRAAGPGAGDAPQVEPAEAVGLGAGPWRVMQIVMIFCEPLRKGFIIRAAV